MNRRTLLKRALAVSAIGVAASAGLLAPGLVLAAYPKAAFQAKDTATALNDALGSSSLNDSGDIKIEVSSPAENAAIIPVTVSTGMSGVESITILADSNATPLVGSFVLSNAEPYITTRIKMGKTGNVVAVVKSGGKLYSAKKNVKVSIGGCGG